MSKGKKLKQYRMSYLEETIMSFYVIIENFVVLITTILHMYILYLPLQVFTRLRPSQVWVCWVLD